MKKHLFPVPFFTLVICLAAVDAQASFRTPGIWSANTIQTGRDIALQTLGVDPSDSEWKPSRHEGGGKCHKGKKGKGKGKSKGHGRKHDCCCHRDCDRGNDGYGHDDQGDYGGNDRNDRYSNPPNKGNGGSRQQGRGTNTRAGQHTSTAKVKTRPAQRSVPASTRPGVPKKSIPVPGRNRK